MNKPNWDKLAELRSMFLPAGTKHMNESFIWCMDQLEASWKREELAKEPLDWAQALLTSLNVGNVESESRLHRQLKKVMIEYRKAMEAVE